MLNNSTISFENISSVYTNLQKEIQFKRCIIFKHQTNLFICFSAISIIGLFGIIGNSIAVIVTTRQRPRSTYNTLLIVLAIADGIVSISVMADGTSWLLQLTCNISWKHRIFVDKLNVTIHDSAQLVSIWILVVMTIERYFTIRNVFSKILGKIKIIFVIIIIITTSVILVCLRRHFKRSAAIFAPIDLTLRYLIPFVILFFLNIQLILIIRRIVKRHLILTQSVVVHRGTGLHENNVQGFSGMTSKTYTVILVVVIFLVCGFFRGTVVLLQSYTYGLYMYHNFLLDCSSRVLMNFNSSINCVLYILIYKKFRSDLRTMCKSSCCTKPSLYTQPLELMPGGHD